MRSLLAWALLTAAGSALIALPDTGPGVMIFSGEHGPGAVDLAGVVLLLAGFGLLLQVLWRRRMALAQRLSAKPRLLALLAFLLGLGSGLVIAGVFTDFWWWWLVGAATMQAFWLALFAIGYRPA